MTNTALLMDCIDKSGLKKGHIAKCLGITAQSLNNKINNKSEFKGSEMETIGKLLGIDNRVRDQIFFAR